MWDVTQPKARQTAQASPSPRAHPAPTHRRSQYLLIAITADTRVARQPVVKPLYGQRVEVTGAVLSCLPDCRFGWSASLLPLGVTLSATAPFITDKTDETDGTYHEAARVTPKPPPSLPPVD